MPGFTLVSNGISAKTKPFWQHLPERRLALEAGARFGLDAHAPSYPPPPTVEISR